MNAFAKLELQMNKDKPILSILVKQSIVKTNDGYIGFMITRGLWHKLRVYNCQEKESMITISQPKIYDNLSYENAQIIMKDLKH